MKSVATSIRRATVAAEEESTFYRPERVPLLIRRRRVSTNIEIKLKNNYAFNNTVVKVW
jgi:hypothetical protein